MSFVLASLPPKQDLETPKVLRQAALAHRYLAELKGLVKSIPNEAILINTLVLQEAKDSSAIENIVTTHDELYREELFPEQVGANAKEVRHYVSALRKGYALVRKEGMLTSNHIKLIQAELEQNDAGLRSIPGTVLKNDQTGAVVYTPPQEKDQIVALMVNLERVINDDDAWPVDPLVKMAALHYQFESIHPFYDGNGRTGRILNVLFLVQKGLLDIPVLYLSRDIIRRKADYYRLLQAVRDQGAWEEWTLYMLQAVEGTAKYTLGLVQGIGEALLDYKHRIRSAHRFYSQDLINSLFNHPYTKIDHLRSDLKVSRLTATRYLDALVRGGFLKKQKLGRSNYYSNVALFKLLTKD
jgi:Fic family protein